MSNVRKVSKSSTLFPKLDGYHRKNQSEEKENDWNLLCKYKWNWIAKIYEYMYSLSMTTGHRL